jgi:hypothetical protein
MFINSRNARQDKRLIAAPRWQKPRIHFASSIEKLYQTAIASRLSLQANV